jgi:hypothetical protein
MAQVLLVGSSLRRKVTDIDYSDSLSYAHSSLKTPTANSQQYGIQQSELQDVLD